MYQRAPNTRKIRPALARERSSSSVRVSCVSVKTKTTSKKVSTAVTRLVGGASGSRQRRGVMGVGLTDVAVVALRAHVVGGRQRPVPLPGSGLGCFEGRPGRVAAGGTDSQTHRAEDDSHGVATVILSWADARH